MIMMNISFEVIAIAALATALVTLVMAYSRNARLRAQLEAQQESLRTLQSDVRAVCSGAVKLGEHLARLEQRSHHLGQRQDQLEMSGSGSQSYQHAKKMMHKGAPLEEVMADCGIARGEAELVALSERIKNAS
jgi:diphthamide synthase (EF-2-diphthine--ammonia ligase)